MIIGITGGIGSGKSVIAKQLREMGYAVYDTDSEAKRLIVEDSAVRKQIEEVFGKEVYADGVYQTHLVAQRVFANKALLATLNAIVHPAVKADIQRWAKEQAGHNTLCFVECAILYSSGIAALCDKVVAVTAPEAIRIERTIARDHTTIEKVRARIQAQDKERDVEQADLVVNNDGNTKISTICLQIRDFFCNFAG